MYICYTRWTWTRQVRLTKMQRRWNSCGHSMPLPSSNLSKLIKIGWEVSVSEPKFTSDGVEAAFRHELLQEIEAWICLFIKGGKIPKSSILYPLQVDIKIHIPKWCSRYQYLNRAISTSFISMGVDGRIPILNHLIGIQFRNMSM